MRDDTRVIQKAHSHQHTMGTLQIVPLCQTHMYMILNPALRKANQPESGHGRYSIKMAIE